MKKIVRTIAVVALLFFVATGLAKEPKLSLTPNTEKSLNFEMDATLEKTAISIIDTEGTIIYSESVTAANLYSKKFNLNNLPKGGYFLKVEDSLRETIFAFSVEDSKIVIAERNVNAKPVFRRKEGKVYLNLLNLDEKDVKIKVLDSSDDILFEETISNTTLVEKVFNFENALDGNYTISVQDKMNSYYEVVVVN